MRTQSSRYLVKLAVAAALLASTRDIRAASFTFSGFAALANFNENPIREVFNFVPEPSAAVTAATANGQPDTLIGLGDTLHFSNSPRMIDEAQTVTGPNGSYPFTPASQFVTDGLTLNDTLAGEQFIADLSLNGIATTATDTIWTINQLATLNLTNIRPGTGYVQGASPLVDEFVTAGSASLILSFTQVAPSSITSLLTWEAGEPVSATAPFSGGAAAAVPEPGASAVAVGAALAFVAFGLRIFRRTSLGSPV